MGLAELQAYLNKQGQVPAKKVDVQISEGVIISENRVDINKLNNLLSSLPSELEITVKKKNIVLDASMFTSYQGCKRYFNLVHNMSLVKLGGKGNSLEAGLIGHKILEIYYINLINGFDRKLSIAAGMLAGEEYYHGCKECKSFHSTGIQCPNPNHKDPNDWLGCPNVPLDSEKYTVGYNYIVDTFGQYFDFYVNDQWIALESEIVKGRIIYEDEEIRIMWKAKIDVTVDAGQLGIVSMDHKTMKVNREMLKLNNQFMGQCLIMERNNIVINKIGWQKGLKPAEKFIREIKSYSNDVLDEWKNVIVPGKVYEFLHSIDNDDWPPDFTHCETKYGPCQFHKVCESDRAGREGELRRNFIVGPKWDPTND